ncbi:DUF2326 domain-containing protein [Pseudomonas sp. K2]|uniref:DUF2326 domain-containing protein n=1 Tax=Pseudomonas sp. K2 TaxID=212119 RepID=UPI00186642DD|nr:DUF2326 domain-containing protein [Pseudomonas sp. K2]
MKISRIYSNFESEFSTVDFHDGFNVILGRVFNKTLKSTDAHNLGKSKLAELIDFCLLKGRHKTFFLFDFFPVFEKYEFYIELKLNSGEFLTVKRGVSKNTRIFLRKHSKAKQCFRGLEDALWDYSDLAIDKARLVLDSYLNLLVIDPWSYRDAIAYCLRGQDDYTDVFQLDKHRGQHVYWKPYVGHLLGFDSHSLKRNYLLKSEVEALREEIAFFFFFFVFFFFFDVLYIEELADGINSQISDLNNFRYYLSARLKKLNKSLASSDVKIELDSLSQLFEESGVIFDGQLKRTFGELVEFNRKITIERQGFIFQQIGELESELVEIASSISELSEERSKKLGYLRSQDVFLKYQEVSDLLSEQKSYIYELNRRLEVNSSVKSMEADCRKLIREKDEVVEKIRMNRDSVIRSNDGIYKGIKEHFANFVTEVLNKDGVLITEQNAEGNLEYSAGLLNGLGRITGESDGHSYRKMLCIGFDIAVAMAYSKMEFVRFLYHDGGLETLDDRKKIEFIEYVRTASSLSGIQYILTTIDSDVPDGVVFSEYELARVLHDEGSSGRLFNIPTW